MAQVLRNILSNALKFTSAEGCVAVNIEHQQGKLIVAVKDSGFGISFENQKRLFSEVVQFHAKAHQAGGGSGLGMWISKKIVDMHGGSIAVFSEGEGRGATFTFTLPMKASFVPNEARAESFRQARSPSFRRQPSVFVKDPSGNLKDSMFEGLEGTSSELPILDILIVDDSELNRKMIMRSLTEDGHYFTEAVDGIDAVEIVSKAIAERRRFDVITMDNVHA